MDKTLEQGRCEELDQLGTRHRNTNRSTLPSGPLTDIGDILGYG
jgi:hypothetical protein